MSGSEADNGMLREQPRQSRSHSRHPVAIARQVDRRGRGRLASAGTKKQNNHDRHQPLDLRFRRRRVESRSLVCPWKKLAGASFLHGAAAQRRPPPPPCVSSECRQPPTAASNWDKCMRNVFGRPRHPHQQTVWSSGWLCIILHVTNLAKKTKVPFPERGLVV